MYGMCWETLTGLSEGQSTYSTAIGLRLGIPGSGSLTSMYWIRNLINEYHVVTRQQLT